MVYNNHEAQTLRMCAKLDSISGFILACAMVVAGVHIYAQFPVEAERSLYSERSVTRARALGIENLMQHCI